jgi:hypothetical protein
MLDLAARNAICMPEEWRSFLRIPGRDSRTPAPSLPESCLFFRSLGFENHLRCVSLLANEKTTPTTLEEQKRCDHEGHVVYQDLKDSSEK